MKIQKIIDDLLFLENDLGRLNNAAKEYFAHLSQITQITDTSSDSADEIETILKDGKAISPKDAARCVLDFARTTKFLRGIYAAIQETKNHFPNEKIEILYAGCGPFAALVVPICTKFKPEEISFSLIDIHQRSLDSAKKIFQTLGLEKFVSDYIQTDVSSYRFEDDKKFHIIITETMQKTLEKEPQVAITLNLVKQMREGGILIPKRITVKAYLANIGKEFAMNSNPNLNRERIYLGDIFDLSAKTAHFKNELFKPKIIEVPEGDFGKMNLILTTKVEVFDDFILGDYDSGITCPTVLHDFKKLKNKARIEFRYLLGRNPRFEYAFV